MMSALPIGPGVTKLTGEGGDKELKSFERSHVVCHYQIRSMYVRRRKIEERHSQYPKFAEKPRSQLRQEILGREKSA